MSHELYRLIRKVEQNGAWFRLDRHREDSVMITVTLVGERIEIDVFEDGHIEYSRFKGNEDVESDPGALIALLDQEAAEDRRG